MFESYAEDPGTSWTENEPSPNDLRVVSHLRVNESLARTGHGHS